jgi:hypothetical protein
VKRLVRLVLLAYLLAALPLRGYAGVVMTLCEGHHGGAAAAIEAEHAEHAHDHGDSHSHTAAGENSNSPAHAASVCSACASCSLSAGLAVTTNTGLAVAPPGTSRIPFLDCQVAGFVPEHLERPPLAL